MRSKTVATVGQVATVACAAAALLGFTFAVPGVLDSPTFDGRWWIGAILGASARALSFRIYRRARIAIDSSIYVAIAFQLNVLSAAWLVAAILAGDGMVRTGHRLVHGTLDGSLAKAIFERLYNAAAPSLLLLLLGLAFQLDGLPQPLSLVSLVVIVPVFSAAFLLLHYFAAGSLQWFDGSTSREVLREYAGRVIGVELSLVPLTIAMIITLDGHGTTLFLLIGTMALVFSAMYRRAVTTSASLDERVHELSVLNAVGRLLSQTLDRRALYENLARESCRLVGASSHCIIATPAADGEAMHCQIYEDTGRLERSVDVSIKDGLVGWVFEHAQPLRLDDLEREYEQYADRIQRLDTRFKSWLGVPLMIYDEPSGVIAVETEQNDAYDGDHVRVMSTIADQAAVALENARLYELATIDGLTELYVRRYFDQRLDEELARAKRYESEFAVGILDLDRFKRLNDTYGHTAGDQVLRAAARAARKNMRGADLACRYGGEEFAFIFPRTSAEDAARVAERIRADIENLRVESSKGEIRVTASIGIAAYPAMAAESASELVSFADEALYQAKNRGRNRVEVRGSASGSAARESG